MAKGFSIRVQGGPAAVRKLERKMGILDGSLKEVVQLTLLQGEGHMRRMLSQPGSGRWYGSHRASAPGEPPAPDTGQYRASWRHRLVASGHGLHGGDLYTEQQRAPRLEYGDRRIRPRPHAGPVAEKMAEDFKRNAVRSLRRAEAA